MIEEILIPESWIEIPFSEILFLRNGFAFKSTDYKSTGVPLIRISDINNEIVEINNAVKIPKELFDDHYEVEKGDILIAMSGATTGKFGIYNRSEKVLQNQRVGNFKLYYDKLPSKFIYYLLGNLRKKIYEGAYGGAQPNISASKIEEIKIPLPPLNEQKRIVSKIEELFSDLDNGIDNLKLAQNQLKVYKQALLKHAFEGKLTERWRKENNPEPVEKLLEQIKKERQKRYEKDLADWKKAMKKWEKDEKKGKKPIKPKIIKELNDFTKAELKEYPNLPDTWKWLKIDKLTEYDSYSIKAGPFGSSLKKEFYVEKGYKIYGQEQVISGNHKIGDYYINEAKYQELISCSIKPYDVLISLVGTIGKVLILPEDCEKGIINPRLIKLSLERKYYLPQIFKFYFESYFLKNLYSKHTHGATMDVLNLGIIQALPFPIMAQEEQIQISSELESQFSMIEKLEQTIESSLKKSEALRQSILKKAFEGNLIEQDPTDEPAKELIKRIKEEKKKYLEEQIELKKSTPKKIKKMSKELSIVEVLKTSNEPMLASKVWLESKHKDNIEEFYAELKKIQYKIDEIKEGKISKLSLKK